MTPFDPGMSLTGSSGPIVRAASGGLSTSCLGLLQGLRLARMHTSCFFFGPQAHSASSELSGSGPVCNWFCSPPQYCTRDCRSQFPLLGKIVQLILAQNESNN